MHSNHSEDTATSESRREKHSSSDLERSDDDEDKDEEFLIGCLDLMFEDCTLSNESFDFHGESAESLHPTKLRKKLRKQKELH